MNGSSPPDVGGDHLLCTTSPAAMLSQISTIASARGTPRASRCGVGRVVERALEPLRGGGEGGIERVHDDVARQRVDSFGAHRIALVRHRAASRPAPPRTAPRSRLQVREQPHVVRELRAPTARTPESTSQACESILREYVWPETGRAACEAHLLGDEPFEPLRPSRRRRRTGSRNDACVPVAPFTPRKRQRRRARNSISRRSSSSPAARASRACRPSSAARAGSA